MFVLDDLSGLSGFNNSWSGENATDVHFDAIMANVDLSDIMHDNRALKLQLTKFPLVKDATIEVAEQTVK